VPLTCLIVDDNAGFGCAARAWLECGGIDVVAIAMSGDDGLARVAEFRPDVVLVDVDLGDESGFDVARRFVVERHEPAVILISAYDEAEYLDLIAASPALGFIPKLELSAHAIRKLLWRRDAA
jgi:DNA-binding NarL/FixJ family response regulator